MVTSDPRLGEVTRLLHLVRDGDKEAFDHLLPLVYEELRRIARRQLRRERQQHTLQPTGLVHEAYLKLVDQAAVAWQGRAHFLGVAARAMRQILVDYARRRNAGKRGGDWVQTTLTHRDLGIDMPLEELISLDAALDRLDELDPKLRQVVEYRFFAGMTEEEIAEVQGVTTRTVQRAWAKARAWLYKELYPEDGAPAE